MAVLSMGKKREKRRKRRRKKERERIMKEEGD